MDDLISRDKATMHLTKARMIGDYRPMSDICSEIPSAFERMTNGEVMKAVFPNCYMGIDDDEWIVTNIDGRTMFQPEWWNAPYQKGGE